ncbi:MAG: DUF3486 family protein [Candidatus Hydrogenedens sp.]|nr:DUF3486 family protein [Candidatus Hydrogenedentota bacterium]NLF56537.1 DUF3486 family protein [Candidatus Hydrogenedens sp.]
MPPKSKIAALPADVRRWLDAALAEGNFSGYDLLSSALQERGYGISRASVHRYGQRLERRLAAIRASTEAARAIAETAPDDADHRSAAVISLVQSELFEMILKLEEAGEGAEPGERVALLSSASRSIADLARASIAQKKHAETVRQRDLQKLRELENDAREKRSALDPETLRMVRETLYGG